MDSSELAHIFDAITGGTCADRFLSTLAGDSPDSPPLAATDLPMPTPAFDMPVVAAQACFPLDTLPATAAIHPADMPQQVFESPYLPPDYSIPASAVTASYRSNTNSASRDSPIHKKKRTRSHRSRKDSTPARPITSAAPNVSFASDISAITPTDELSFSSIPRDPPVKPEPHLSSEPLSHITAKPSTPSCSFSANRIHLANTLSHPRTKSSHSSTTPTPPKSHTRKCREKVTRQFENLLEVLPIPPRGIEVKHKAQILDYTINIFKDLLLRRTSLHAEIALASKPALTQWINNAIATAASCMKRDARTEPVPLTAILEPFLGLYCVKKNWTYGELWLVDSTKKQASLASCVFNSDDNDILKRLDSFATESRSRYLVPSKLSAGIISRAAVCHRPEWLEQPASDRAIFSRADIASSSGVCIVQSIPIVLGKNQCSAVMLFADVNPHTFSTTDMDVANEYADVLSEGYVQYLQRVQQRCTTVHIDSRIQAKPICSAETKPQVGNQLPSTDPHFPSVGSGTPAMNGGLASQTDSSSRFFADSDLMARHCF